MSSTPTTTEELIAKFKEKTAALREITQKSLKIITDYKAKSASGPAPVPPPVPAPGPGTVEEAEAAAALAAAAAAAASSEANATINKVVRGKKSQSEENAAVLAAAAAAEAAKEAERVAEEARVEAEAAAAEEAQKAAAAAAAEAARLEEEARQAAAKAKANKNAAYSRAAEEARVAAEAAAAEAARLAEEARLSEAARVAKEASEADARAQAAEKAQKEAEAAAKAAADAKVELIGGAAVDEINTVDTLADLPQSIMTILAKAKPILSIKSHIITKEDYDNVYLTSDIHADLRKFIRLLVNAGLIKYNNYDVKTLEDGDIDSKAVYDFEWIAPQKTLLIIIGDLVDGLRGPGFVVNDTKGNIELLLHIFLYNLRVKALEKGSDIRFTLGNHEYVTVLLNEEFYITRYVHYTAKIYFSNKCRKRCLLPFYDCCPYIFLTLGDEVICVHGGLGGLNDTVINYQTRLQAQLNGAITIETILVENEIKKILSDEDNTPLWSRKYAGLQPKEIQGVTIYPTDEEKKADIEDTCAKIGQANNTQYALTVVGHCTTPDTRFPHFNKIRAKYKEAKPNGHNDGGRCDHGGCVLIGCEEDTGPKLAFVDIAMSEAMTHESQITEKRKNTQRAEFLHLQHDPQHPDTKRYYNIISRIKLDDGNGGKESILMWHDPSIGDNDAESVMSFGSLESLGEGEDEGEGEGETEAEGEGEGQGEGEGEAEGNETAEGEGGVCPEPQTTTSHVEPPPANCGNPKGKVGLRNLGNTCFLNASLQLLYRIIPFRDYFINLNTTIEPFNKAPFTNLHTIFSEIKKKEDKNESGAIDMDNDLYLTQEFECLFQPYTEANQRKIGELKRLSDDEINTVYRFTPNNFNKFKATKSLKEKGDLKLLRKTKLIEEKQKELKRTKTYDGQPDNVLKEIAEIIVGKDLSSREQVILDNKMRRGIVPIPKIEYNRLGGKRIQESAEEFINTCILNKINDVINPPNREIATLQAIINEEDKNKQLAGILLQGKKNINDIEVMIEEKKEAIRKNQNTESIKSLKDMFDKISFNIIENITCENGKKIQPRDPDTSQMYDVTLISEDQQTKFTSIQEGIDIGSNSEIHLNSSYKGCDGSPAVKKIISTFGKTEYLIVNPKRFYTDLTSGDNKRFDDSININKVIKINNVSFEIISIIIQRGSLKGGHYFNYSKTEDSWYEFNDSSVSKLEIEDDRDFLKFKGSDDISENGYILCYKRLEAPAAAAVPNPRKTKGGNYKKNKTTRKHNAKKRPSKKSSRRR